MTSICILCIKSITYVVSSLLLLLLLFIFFLCLFYILFMCIACICNSICSLLTSPLQYGIYKPREVENPSAYFGTGIPSSNISTLSIGVSVRLTNYSHWDSFLRWFMGVKNSQMFIQTKTSQRLEIIAR